MQHRFCALLILVLCGCEDAPSPQRAPEHLALPADTPSTSSAALAPPAPTASVTVLRPGDAAYEAICGSIYNGYDCAQALERRLLPAERGGVVRDGRVLRIALARGDAVTYTDSLHDDTQGMWFSYRGRFGSIGYHLVEIQFYEGRIFLLVNGRTGWTTWSDGVPMLSPDGAQLAAANVDIDAEHSSTSLQVWRVAADSLELAFSQDFDLRSYDEESVWGPANLEWLSSTELRFDRMFAASVIRGTGRVVRESNRWRMLVP